MILLSLLACLVPDPPSAQGCADCHGSGGNPAPPEGLGGTTDPTEPGVGAHAVHLSGTSLSAPVACAECHHLPATLDEPGHVDSDVPAEVGWAEGRLSKRNADPYDASTTSCFVYCHGSTLSGGANTEPVWTEPGSIACGDCHSLPPSAPHPAVADDSCGECHDDAEGGRIVDPSRHVDGRVDFRGTATTSTATTPSTTTPTTPSTTPPASCATGCHGTDDDPAPPPDLTGSSDPRDVGVGAHAIHLHGGGSGVAIACATCHTVPASVGAAGHRTDAPGDDLFSGIALRRGHAPRFEAATESCADTYCHDAGGTTPEPVWTDPAPLACDACHGLPPALPHTSSTDCARCHPDAGPGFSITDPSRHVDGTVTL